MVLLKAVLQFLMQSVLERSLSVLEESWVLFNFE